MSVGSSEKLTIEWLVIWDNKKKWVSGVKNRSACGEYELKPEETREEIESMSELKIAFVVWTISLFPQQLSKILKFDVYMRCSRKQDNVVFFRLVIEFDTCVSVFQTNA